jgi:cellobiose phosphorylase
MRRWVRAAAGWYTGQSAWRYRAGLENMLALRRCGTSFAIDPRVRSLWATYDITWRHLGTRYHITVVNPRDRCSGVTRATLDGVEVHMHVQHIPAVDDGDVDSMHVVHRLTVDSGVPDSTRHRPPIALG